MGAIEAILVMKIALRFIASLPYDRLYKHFCIFIYFSILGPQGFAQLFNTQYNRTANGLVLSTGIPTRNHLQVCSQQSIHIHRFYS